jgi:signal transduction histidine kinase
MDFTAVAHDLRTPLNAMLGHTRLLSIEALSEAGRQRLEIIEAQIRRMATLLDTCLPHPPRHAAGAVDLAATLRNVVAELEAMLQRRGVEVTVGEAPMLPPVAGDGDELHRVLVNVIVNAADAMPEGGRIHVRARVEPVTMASTAVVAIDVVDSGTGIPAELLSRVFDRGFTTKPDGDGAGLGLAICREIVQAHGGDIALSSVEGRGTTVHLLLPAGRATLSAVGT